MSIYIHIPFCSNICSYCDFCKFYYNEEIVNKYLLALKEEIINNYKNELVKTIYIGGGTPSCLSIEQLKCLLELTKLFNLDKNYEFTLEINPDISLEKIKLLKEYNVNRVSMGMQTINEKLLKLLNRKHAKEDIIKVVNNLKNNAINNINIDLIYAIPSESLNDLENDLDFLLSLDIPHISTYSLIIEPHTKLYIDNVSNIDEDLDYEMYQLILKKLSHFKHYEISNFAIKGYESKHNLTYWNNDNYYGFGLSSSGFIGNIRYENTRSINDYLNKNYIKEKNELSKMEMIENEFILGLRKIDGIDINLFKEKYGFDIDIKKPDFEIIEIQAETCEDPKRKKELEEIGKMMAHIMRGKVDSFYEGVETVYLLHLLMMIESNGHSVNHGRFDQYMYPYYKADIEKGRLTKDDAYELLLAFFLSCNKDSDLYPGMQQGDNGQSLVLGGITPDGEDAFYRLSELCLIASGELRVIDPKINLRVNKNTPKELWDCAIATSRLVGGLPLYYNDEIVVPMMQKELGYELRDARDYGCIGCQEIVGCGNDYPAPNGLFPPHATVWWGSLLDMAINDGVNPMTGKQGGKHTGTLAEMTSFQQVLNAYKTQFDFFMDWQYAMFSILDKAGNSKMPLPAASASIPRSIPNRRSWMPLRDCTERRLW